MSAPRFELRIARMVKVPCESLAEASAAYCAVRDESGEGSSTFPNGIVIVDGGAQRLVVSYNGKIWANGHQCVYGAES